MLTQYIYNTVDGQVASYSSLWRWFYAQTTSCFHVSKFWIMACQSSLPDQIDSFAKFTKHDTHMEHDEGDYQNSFKQNISAISSSFMIWHPGRVEQGPKRSPLLHGKCLRHYAPRKRPLALVPGGRVVSLGQTGLSNTWRLGFGATLITCWCTYKIIKQQTFMQSSKK